MGETNIDSLQMLVIMVEVATESWNQKTTLGMGLSLITPKATGVGLM